MPIEDLRDQIERIVQSLAFEHTQTLQRLLRYLAARSIEFPGDAIKEYTIGVEVLERRPTFDPKEDTIVRVQVHRLREKLQEYYAGEGVHDPILISIPRGRYLPSFEPRAVLPPPPEPAGPDPIQPPTAQLDILEQPKIVPSQAGTQRRASLRTALIFGLAALGAGACFFAGLRSGSHSAVQPDGEDSARLSSILLPKTDPVRSFWAAILGNDPAPIVAFTNPVYLIDSSNDLFPYPEGAVDYRGASVDPVLARKYAPNASRIGNAQRLSYESGYTGTGDLKGVAALVQLLTRMGFTPTVKPGRDLTTEDFAQHTVIALGSSFQGIAAAQLAPIGDLRFDWPSIPHGTWAAQIRNLNPSPNESSIYKTERDPQTRVLKADYSIVSVQSSIAPGRYIVILAGLDTAGTEGAALFATSRTGVDAMIGSSAPLADSLHHKRAPIFQALLRVNLANGSDVLGCNLVTVHIPQTDQRDHAIPAAEKSTKQ